MKILETQLVYHIDSLREQQDISISDFVNGVCERRQYSRYLSGEYKLSHKNMIGFLDKLGLSLVEFYYSFYRSELSEYHLVNNVYSNLIVRDLDMAKKNLLDLEDFEFSDGQTKQFYEYCVIYFNYLSKKDYIDNTYSKLSKLIDYPNCLTRSSFSFVEISTIRLLSEIEFQKNSYQALNFLYTHLIKNENVYLFSDKRDIMPSIYANVSRLFGMAGELEKSNKIAELGIKYCIKHESSFLLNSLYYYSSLYHFKTGNKSEAYNLARKAIFVLESKGNYKKLEMYKKMLDKDFNIDFNDILMQYKI